MGSTAVATDGPELHDTFAHELGHLLGGDHTFDAGGLMAYSHEMQLADNNDICPYIAQVTLRLYI
jgi:hypothetical protein